MIIELNSDHRNTVLLAGMGRSGSTWVGDILNYDNSYRDIFEPFFPAKVPEAKSFAYPQYIRPDNKDGTFLKAAKQILSGSFRNKWTDHNNKRLFTTKRLIKDIRANLFLKWVHENFPGIPIILLLRHPCAIIPSWLKAGFGDGTRAQQRILEQAHLLEDHIAPFAEQFAKTRDPFERLVFFWCIYYYVPLKQFKRDEICVTFYENFYLKPREELDKIFSFIGRSYSEKTMEILSKPSRTTTANSNVLTGGDIVNGWKKYVSAAQVEKAYEIMALFGFDKIYSKDAVPDQDQLFRLMK